MPEINTIQGFIFYTFVTYLFTLFYGWLTNPTLEKMRDDVEKSRDALIKTRKMR